jgi:predicted metalloenzyme YecM
MYQIATKLHKPIKYSTWPNNIPTLPIPRPSKIYPNLDFWFENMPSGNPGSSDKVGEMMIVIVVEFATCL